MYIQLWYHGKPHTLFLGHSPKQHPTLVCGQVADLENVEKFQSQYVGMVCSTDKNVTVFGISVTVFYMATVLQQLLPTYLYQGQQGEIKKTGKS